MPVSKKMAVKREQKKKDALGTRAPVKANGLPVKPPKPTSICANCRKEIVNTNLKQLEVHAETHNQKLWPKEKCWPKEFPATTTTAAEIPAAVQVEEVGEANGSDKEVVEAK